MAIDGRERLGVRREPEREADERLVDRVEHPVVRRPDRGSAAELAHLDVQERRPDERLDHPVDRLRGADP